MPLPCRRVTVAFAAVLLLVASVLTPAAQAAPTTSSATGPALTVPTATLAAALQCSGSLRAGPTPVLLVPGTTLTPDVNFDWNYEQVFTAAGRSWCAVTLPNHGMSDIQIAGQYVVQALRTMHARAGRAVAVVGYSQGGMVPRWALKWWPDTRADVADVIGIDPSNHGTLDTVALCLPGCAPALWQQQSGSTFLTALNKGGETFAGISYTQVYSATDEIVVPNLGPAASSALHTGPGAIANIEVQSICPVHVAEHLSMGTFDPVGYAVVLDALEHAGPAVATRISPAVCLQATMPGVSLASVATNFPRVLAEAGAQVTFYPHVAAEPALAAYARG